MTQGFRVLARVMRAVVVAGAVGLSAGAASAQSSSSITVNGVEITITGGSSQSVSTTSTGAEVILDGRTVVIDGTTISLDGSSFDSGAFEAVEIVMEGNTLRILVDGKERMSSTRSTDAGGDTELTEAAKMNNLGVAYYRGDGVEQSYEQAVIHYEKAVALGSTIAADNLAIIFWWGIGEIPADRARAVTFAQIGFEGEHAESTHFWGMAHVLGLGVEADPARGIALLDMAGDLGSSNALNQLGIYYARGEHVAQDAARAVAYYQRAAEMDNSAAQANLAWKTWDGDGTAQDPMEALRLAEISAEKGNRSATFLVGVINYFGADGIAVNKEVAGAFFLRAAEAGHDTAAFNLGVMYRDGDGLPQDLDEAIRWMQAAVERGYDGADAQLEKLMARKAEAATPATPAPQESAIWWYVAGQERVGPMTLSDLRAEMGAGKFGAEGLVWREGMADWAAAGSLPELAN